MRPPEFWSGGAAGRDSAPMLQALLTPLGALYAAAAAQRMRAARPVRVAAPVICIGNLTLGGAGKTPVTRALRALLGAGDTHVVARGYGGREKGPLRVTPDAHAREVGDEPLLHAHDGPTWVSRDRVRGAQAAIGAGAKRILLDDGFQNPSLRKDLSIVVIDAGSGFGNGKVFPAGPLRESLAGGLARADAIIVMQGARTWAPPPALAGFAKPILEARLVPSAAPPSGPLLAFAGIARPQKFFDTLAAAGATIEEAAPFPDHHRFTAADLAWLSQVARERSAQLITTEKDHVRLPPAWRARIAVLPVRAVFDAPEALHALLGPIAAQTPASA